MITQGSTKPKAQKTIQRYIPPKVAKLYFHYLKSKKVQLALFNILQKSNEEYSIFKEKDSPNNNPKIYIDKKKRTLYYGQLQGSTKNGFGVFSSDKEFYCGYWSDNVKSGKGLFINFQQNSVSNASFVKGQMRGFAQVATKDAFFKGELCKGSLSSGTVIDREGEFQGIASPNEEEFGTFKAKNKESYRGSIFRKVPQGVGQYRIDRLKILGTWRGGLQHGVGIQTQGKDEVGLWKKGIWSHWIC